MGILYALVVVLSIVHTTLSQCPPNGGSQYKSEYYTYSSKYSKGGWCVWGCTRYRGHSAYRSVCNVGYYWQQGWSCEPKCTTCVNGGTCGAPQWCTCTHQPIMYNVYQPYCHNCPVITYCRIRVCDCPSGSNVQCHECEHHYAALQDPEFDVHWYQAYYLTSDKKQCIKRCSWRADSNTCFPGFCGHEILMSQCQCAAGFGSNSQADKCRKILADSNYLKCLMFFRDQSHNTVVEPEFLLDGVERWTNQIEVDKIDWDVEFNFPAPTIEKAHKPAWVSEYLVGISTADLSVKLKRNGTSDKTVMTQHFMQPNNIIKDSFYSQTSQTLSGANKMVFEHEDTIEITWSIRSGGYINIKNLEYGSNMGRENYQGKDTPRTRIIRVDYVVPYSPTPLNLAPWTHDQKITVNFPGWQDDQAGIGYYDIIITPMTKAGATGLQIHHTATNGPEAISKIDRAATSQEIDFGAGAPTNVYQVELAACDDVFNQNRNCKEARRFVLYDAGTTITAKPPNVFDISDTFIFFEERWMLELDIPVTVNYINYFWNEVYHLNNLMGAIATDETKYIEQYEHLEGDRNISAIVNNQGVITYYHTWKKDRLGGTSIENHERSLAEMDMVHNDHADFATMRYTWTIPREDGDAIRIWVRAYDVIGHYMEQPILMYVDSSPPIIENIGIRNNGRRLLVVHSLEEFYEMEFCFHVYDLHSGIKELSWALYDRELPVYHAAKQEPPKAYDSTAECEAANPDAEADSCYTMATMKVYNKDYCIKPQTPHLMLNATHGGHDHDYWIHVYTTNRVDMKTDVRIEITIDLSAPHPGVVMDGMDGDGDADFQISNQIKFHWADFFDRESGIAFYRIMVGSECYTKDDFNLDDPSQDIYGTHYIYNAAGPGFYRATVVAYNPAMEASAAICSDGITVDPTAPFVEEIKLDGGRTKMGLVKQQVIDSPNYDVYFINWDFTRQPIQNPSQACIDNALTLNDVTFIPRPRDPLGNLKLLVPLESDVCDGLKPWVNATYYSQESQASVSWQMFDEESGMHNAQVGFMSSDSASGSPDLMPYMSTSGRDNFVTFDTQLVQGLQFWIVVKAMNKAGYEVTKVVGPYFIDCTAPEIDTDLTITYKKDDLVISWEDKIVDHEDDIGLTYEYAIGTRPGEPDVQNYQLIESGGSCTGSDFTSRLCTFVPSRGILHGKHEYYFTLKISNGGGLFTLKGSEKYIHFQDPPVAGVVFDLNPSDAAAIYDTDEIRTESVLKGRWASFYDPHQPIQYKVVIYDSSRNVVHSTGNLGTVDEYTATGLTLTPLTRYTFSVEASNSVGTTIVDSDGVVVWGDDISITGATVVDGVACSETVQRKVDKKLSLGHEHHKKDVEFELCAADVDYQMFTTSYGFRFTLPAEIDFINNVRYKLQKSLDGGKVSWVDETEEQLTYMPEEMEVTGVELSPGFMYRSSVRFCQGEICSALQASNGFFVNALPPQSAGLTFSKKNENRYSLEWSDFEDPIAGSSLKAEDFIQSYEWTITDGSSNILHFSNFPQPIEYSYGKTKVEVDLDTVFATTQCLQLVVRAIAKSGQIGTVSTNFFDCDAPGVIADELVVDAVPNGGDITFTRGGTWENGDVDYTSSKTIGAVWPTLNHDKFKWALIDGYGPKAFFDEHRVEGGVDPAGMAGVIQSGTTENQFIQVTLTAEQAMHSHRYYFCVSSDKDYIDHGGTKLQTGYKFGCSNGVTLDLMAPMAGTVYAGITGRESFQSTTSHIIMRWTGFTDIENGQALSHHHGIAKYEYAIGTTPTGKDVRDFTDVGVTNIAVAKDLLLRDGQVYYVRIRASDFVGQTVEAVAEGLTIDSSPPEVNNRAITVGSGIQTNKHVVSACWDLVFTDPESGVAKYSWAVGTKKGSDDIQPYTDTTDSCGLTAQNLNLKDGEDIFVTIVGINGGNLKTLAHSGAIPVDTTPPVSGEVYELAPDNVSYEPLDVDYQVEIDRLRVLIKGFEDPQTNVVECYYKIGSCPECDNILTEKPIGLQWEQYVENLVLPPGKDLYVTARCCNAARQCSTIVSDGIIADPSPPSKGVVNDGLGATDADFQAHDNTLGATWFDFTDPHTGISYYTWFVGTTPGGDDVRAEEKLLRVNSIFTKLTTPLTKGQRVFITVRAYNFAGLYTDATSNGLMVEDAKPDIAKEISIDEDKGVILPGTQVMSSLICASWEFDSTGGPLVAQSFSIITSSDYASTDNGYQAVQLNPTVTNYCATNLTLHDGVTYTVNVVACTRTALCAETSVDVLVDSTPPKTGTFAVETIHAVNHTQFRQPDSHIEWSGDTVKLAWLGFADYHSGIKGYGLRIGTSYMADDLASEEFVHVGEGQSFADEGVIQTATITLNRALTGGEVIYAHMWAENNVGMVSYVAHSAFEANPSGELELVRRCGGHTCEGACICAPDHKRCQPTGATCQDQSSANGYQKLTVSMYMDIRNNITDKELAEASAARSFLAAEWSVTDDTAEGTPIQRYEYSIGACDGATPGGIFTNFERNWHYTGQTTRAVVNVTRPAENGDGNIARAYSQYKFFVKGWYDADNFAIFESNCVMVVPYPPRIQTAQGVNVKEHLVQDVDSAETDFVNDPSELFVSWKEKFNDHGDLMIAYEVGLGTFCGGDDAVSFSHFGQLDVEVVSALFKNVSLQRDTTYCTTVKALNKAGLFVYKSSDGVVFDVEYPEIGTVFDGIGPGDMDFQASRRIVSANWHGFVDRESYIEKYYWCVGTCADTADCSYMAAKFVGMRTQDTAEMAADLPVGEKICSKIYAFDASGKQSDIAMTDGFIVDITPPYHASHVGVFEDDVIFCSFEPTDLTTWEALEGAETTVWDGRAADAKDGSSFLIVDGGIKLCGTAEVGERYRVTFFASYEPNGSNKHLQGSVSYHGAHRTFRHHEQLKPFYPPTTWHAVDHYFTALESDVCITINSLGGNAMAVDDIQVAKVNISYEEADKAKAVVVTAQHNHGQSNIAARWDVVDEYSFITESLWAIGTVKGGTQLQQFVPVGRGTHDENSVALLTHGTWVHVTVVVVNVAGHSTVLHADPVLIDHTPPIISKLNDGACSGDDIDFQKDKHSVSACFEYSDPDSNMVNCEWALGTSPGGSEAQTFVAIDDGEDEVTFNHESEFPEGTKVYFILRCHGSAGHTTLKISDGVVLANDADDVTDAIFEPVAETVFRYYPLDGFQGSTDSLFFKWGGFKSAVGVAAYEINLTGDNLDVTANVGADSEHHAAFTGLSLTDGTQYSAQIRSINNVGVASAYLAATIFVDATAPGTTDKNMTHDWNDADELTVSWDGVFEAAPNSGIKYEVSLGRMLGGKHHPLFVDTEMTSLTFTGYKPTRDYYALVTAIGNGGKHRSVNYHIPPEA